MDFGMVLIFANDPPPRRVFCFGAQSEYDSVGLPLISGFF
jgi:hypothetical protein